MSTLIAEGFPFVPLFLAIAVLTIFATVLFVLDYRARRRGF
jgi:hypothetical protein